MPIDSKVFCLGIFCNKRFRRKCQKCGINVCKKCEKSHGKKVYCPDCSLEVWLENKKRMINNKIKSVEKEIDIEYEKLKR